MFKTGSFETDCRSAQYFKGLLKYKKSQIGWVIIGLMIPVIIFLYLLYLFQWGDHPLPLVPFVLITILFLTIIALFYKLTVEVDKSHLKVIYGIGWIKIKLNIDEILDTQIIKTPWYYGLGIRLTPRGMLYNIHGLKAVEIKYISNKKNKSVMVGTPEPEKLKRVLEENFKRRT
jgi:hypothetical protein